MFVWSQWVLLLRDLTPVIEDDLKHGHGKFVWPDGKTSMFHLVICLVRWWVKTLWYLFGFLNVFWAITGIPDFSPTFCWHSHDTWQVARTTVSGAKANVMVRDPAQTFNKTWLDKRVVVWRTGEKLGLGFVWVKKAIKDHTFFIFPFIKRFFGQP